MYQTEIISKFGGINKLKDAIKTKLPDDVYCWETGKWCIQRYWNEVADKNLTGITLLDLMTGTPLDATHFSGPCSLRWIKMVMCTNGCLNKIDGFMLDGIQTQQLSLFYKGFAQFLSESVGDTVREKAMS